MNKSTGMIHTGRYNPAPVPQYLLIHAKKPSQKCQPKAKKGPSCLVVVRFDTSTITDIKSCFSSKKSVRMPTSNKRTRSDYNGGNEEGRRQKEPKRNVSDKNDRSNMNLNGYENCTPVDSSDLAARTAPKILAGSNNKDISTKPRRDITKVNRNGKSRNMTKPFATNGFSPIPAVGVIEEKKDSSNHLENSDRSKSTRPRGRITYAPNRDSTTPAKLKKRKDALEVENTTRSTHTSDKDIAQEVGYEHCEEDAENDLISRPSLRSWASYTIGLGMILGMLFVSRTVYGTYLDSRLIEKALKTEVQELHQSVESLQKNLSAIRSTLDLVESENDICHHSLQAAEGKIEKSDEDNFILQRRLDAMVGSGDSIQASLSDAWKQIEQFRSERLEISMQLSSTKMDLSIEREAKENVEAQQRECNQRLVELELESIEADDLLADLESKVQEILKSKNDLEAKLHQQQDESALLQHQLDEENGHSWYYELQMKYLEGLISELEGVVSDLHFEKTTMKNEIQRLQLQILRQNDEAVAALNAVATSATFRKAEQLSMVEYAADMKVESAKIEAVKAVNTVMDAMMKTK